MNDPYLARRKLQEVIERLKCDSDIIRRIGRDSLDEVIEDLEVVEGLVQQQEIFLKGKR